MDTSSPTIRADTIARTIILLLALVNQLLAQYAGPWRHPWLPGGKTTALPALPARQMHGESNNWNNRNLTKMHHKKR